MSGGGGSKRGSSKGKGSKITNDYCLLLEIETSLFSPDEEVINLLKKGDELEIIYSEIGNRIEARTTDDELAGTLVGNKITDLLRCIKDGNKYKGVVQSISGGNCKIKISHR